MDLEPQIGGGGLLLNSKGAKRFKIAEVCTIVGGAPCRLAKTTARLE